MSLAAPFPYFGGKRRAAPIIWQDKNQPRCHTCRKEKK